MATLQNLVEPILAIVPEAPEEAAIFAYRRAAREFFAETLAFLKELSFAAIAGETQTTLVPGTGLEVVDAIECWYGTTRLDKQTKKQFQRVYGNNASFTPATFRIDNPNLLILMPGPTAGGAVIELSAVVRPTDAATTLDDAVVSKYREELECGAVARLLRMPKKAWTDYDGGREYEARFQYEIDRHRSRASDGNMKGVARRVRYGGY